MVRANEFIGKYRIVRKIGSGSFGEVYLAQDTKTMKEVAIKLLKSELLNNERNDAESMREKFHKEVEMLKKLKHPNILPYLDEGFYQGNPYLVTEYAHKGSLEHKMQEQPQRPFKIEEAMAILSQVG